MQADFRIIADCSNNLIDLQIGGFYSQSDVMRFSAAYDDALTRLDCGPNEHLTLVDMRGMQIQPQTSVGAFRDILSDPHKRSRRLAFVVATSLSRMQIKRAAEGRDARYFTEIEAARAWLLDEDESEVPS
ncbi:MAG: hypothetical protein CMN72_02660 [Sphingomonas sp.]|nr:hypothetical protein [Sphingomonas sp.]